MQYIQLESSRTNVSFQTLILQWISHSLWHVQLTPVYNTFPKQTALHVHVYTTCLPFHLCFVTLARTPMHDASVNVVRGSQKQKHAHWWWHYMHDFALAQVSFSFWQNMVPDMHAKRACQDQWGWGPPAPQKRQNACRCSCACTVESSIVFCKKSGVNHVQCIKTIKINRRAIFAHSTWNPSNRVIRKNWNDTEKISMAPAQGWHAQIENVLLFLGAVFFDVRKIPCLYMWHTS